MHHKKSQTILMRLLGTEASKSIMYLAVFLTPNPKTQKTWRCTLNLKHNKAYYGI